MFRNNKKPTIENGRFNRSKPVFDSIVYPSLVDAVEYDGNANTWLENCRMDAARIRDGALDECPEFKNAMARIGNILQKTKEMETIREEIKKLQDAQDEMRVKIPFYGQLIRQYRQSKFTINLRPHEAMHAQNKDQMWNIQLCPGDECTGFVQFQGEESGTCCACSRHVCKTCRQINMDGEEHVCRDEDVESVKQMLKDSKPCPSCLAPIYRESGCSHMFCSKCHYSFDWENMQRLTKGQTTNEMAREYYNEDDDEEMFGVTKAELIPSIPELFATHVLDPECIQFVRDVMPVVNRIELHKPKGFESYKFGFALDDIWKFSTRSSEKHPLLRCLPGRDGLPSHGLTRDLENFHSTSLEKDMKTFVLLVSFMLYSILEMQFDLVSNGSAKADEERYKYVSGIDTEEKYRRFLYRQKKREELIAENNIPQMCQKIEQGIGLFQNITNELKNKTKAYTLSVDQVQPLIGELESDFTTWGYDVLTDVKLMSFGKLRQNLKSKSWITRKLHEVFDIDLS